MFTEGSLTQLQSLGFTVLYFPYESLVAAFKSEGIDIAFDEGTPDSLFRRTTAKIEKTRPKTIARIREHLIASNQGAINAFFDALNRRLGRHITRVVVVPLYGRVNEFATVEDALTFLDGHMIHEGSGQFRKYEIRVDFSNGDKVEAFIESKHKVREFLDFVARQ